MSDAITLNVILEEAIKSWTDQIKEIKKSSEWFDENSPLGRQMTSSIKHKKELIECAKIHLEGKRHAMAGKG